MREDRNKRRENEGKTYEDPTDVICGRNPVRELLASGKNIDKIYIQKGERTGSITVLIAEARSRSIPVVECEKAKLDHISGGANHQGIAAFSAGKEYCEIDDIIRHAEEMGQKPLIVIADRVEDPHNLGALIRAAECAGAHGLIIPKRKGAMLTQVVSKASAGAIEHLMIAKVTNLAAAVDELKEKGLWIFSAEAGGENYYEEDLTCPAAIILGSEGKGVSKLLLDKSDYIISIPMYGKVNSFNVSAAATVILCEAARQRNK